MADEYLPGYLPSSTELDSKAFFPTTINKIPPYPDKGVKFAGYAKELKGNGYMLIPQERVVFNALLDSTAVSFVDCYQVAEGKAFYLTDLIIQKQVSGGTNSLYLTDGVLAGANAVFMDIHSTNDQVHTILHFEVPIKFTTSMRFTILLAGADKVKFNGVGFLEDN